MYIETKRRSLVKGISWRFFATITTIIIVYLFFRRLDLAVLAGVLETVAKILLYFIHERAWNKIKFGKERIEPFNLWFTGLPLSGKTTIADTVYEELKKLDFPVERIDSKDIRELIPDIGYSREDRNRHLQRVSYLIKTLQNNHVSSVASFVSPYADSRDNIRKLTKNYIEVYIKADIESCKKRDYKGVYERAIKGNLENFTGISDIYEEPENADIVIDTDSESIDDAAKRIFKYVKGRCLS